MKLKCLLVGAILCAFALSGWVSLAQSQDFPDTCEIECIRDVPPGTVITVKVRLFSDEPLSGISIPLTFYNPNNPQIACDSVQWSEDWFLASGPSDYSGFGGNMGYIDNDEKIVKIYAIWFADPLPAGDDTLCTIYFTTGQFWDPDIEVRIDTSSQLNPPVSFTLVDAAAQVVDAEFISGCLGGGEACQDPEHFVFRDNTSDSYSIVVDSALCVQMQLQYCDEVGVFDGDLCVGASVYDPGSLPLALVAWEDDSQTPDTVDGYVCGHPMSFRVWRRSDDLEDTATAYYSVGNGNFCYGAYSRLWLDAPCPREPYLEVLYPNGEETVCIDSCDSIRWDSYDVTSVRIEYSTDAGSSWGTIVSSTPSDGSYPWCPVDSTPSNACLVRIWDSDDDDPCDTSDNYFAIEVCPEDTCQDPQHFVFRDNTSDSYSIVVDSALCAGLQLEECDEVGVFDGDLCVGASVYDPNNLPLALVAWEDDSQTPDTVDGYVCGNPMSFRVWRRSDDLEDTATAYYSVGNGNFCYGAYSRLWLDSPCGPQPETLEVLYPNGGDTLCIGSCDSICWYSYNVDSVRIEYSTNAGSSWGTIVSSTPSDGSYPWCLVPNTPSGSCLVRIWDSDDDDPCDTSDNYFAIEVCPEDTCQDPEHFVFRDNTSDSYSIVVDSALCDGLQLEECDEVGVFDGDLCVGAAVYHPDDLPLALVAWEDDSQTPDTVDGYVCGHPMSFRVWRRSDDLEDTATAYYSVGNGNFCYGAYSRLWLDSPCGPQPETLEVLFPNGGDTLCIGSCDSIRWDSYDVSSVRIRYSTDAGSSWMTIVSSTPSDGSYPWCPVDSTPSNSCLIQICRYPDYGLCDTSDNYFTIQVCDTCQYPEHFVFRDNTSDSYSIVVDSALCAGMQLEECDEVGVFDGDLCVGASVYHPDDLPLALVAWEDDSQTPDTVDGYICGHPMSFRVWKKSQDQEDTCTARYSVGDGTFCYGAYSRLWLECVCDGPCVTVLVPDTCGQAGGDICIPLILPEDVTGKEIYSFEFSLTYNSGVIVADSCTAVGTIAEGWGSPTCNISDGQISMAMAGITPLSGSGSLIFACFSVVGSPEDTTTIHFASAMFNEGDPCVDPLDGLFKVCLCSISGHIAYCPWGCWVDSTWVKLTGGKIDSSHTDSDSGYYQFTELPYGLAYTVKPKKVDDTRSAISAFDASIVLRCVVNLLECPPCSSIAGDVSCNRSLSAFDASLILRYVVGIIDSFPCGKDWAFIPADFPLDTLSWKVAPDSIYYPSLTTDLTDQDFRAVLLGDVSGNWCDKAPIAKLSDFSTSQALKMTPPDIHLEPGELVSLTVNVTDLSKTHSAELVLTYDPDILDIAKIQAGDLTKNYLLESNSSEGLIRAALAGDRPISGSGSILKIIVKAKEEASLDQTEIILTMAKLEEQISEDLNLSTIIHLRKSSRSNEYLLMQNMPNPFNTGTVIQFSVPKSCHVRIDVFNLLGRKVATLLDEHREPGNYQAMWAGVDNKGNTVASGTYFYRLKTDKCNIIKKMLLIK